MKLFLDSISKSITQDSAVMVIVTNTGGSTPRKSGARMLVLTDGSIEGTIGGGWLELEATGIAKDMISKGSENCLKRFSLRGRETSNTPMICGGDVELLFQAL